MDKTIADRLEELRSGRTSEPNVPTGQGSKSKKAKEPGYDGRLNRMASIARKKGVTAFEASGAPFEHLMFHGRLLRANEEPSVAAARVEAAYAYRDDMSKAEVAGLGAQVISDSPRGGGSGSTTLSEHKLFAMQSLGEMKSRMHKQEYHLLEAVVWLDQWSFNIPEPKSKPKTKTQQKARRRALEKRRAKVIEQILMVLDLAAAHYGYMTYGEARARWRRPKSSEPTRGQKPPGSASGSARHNPGSTAPAQRALRT